MEYLKLKREKGTRALINRYYRIPPVDDSEPADQGRWPLSARPQDPRVPGVYPSWLETTGLMCMYYVLVELEGVLDGEIRGGKDDELMPYLAEIVELIPDAPGTLRRGIVSQDGYCDLVQYFNDRMSDRLTLGAIIAGATKQYGPYHGLALERGIPLQREQKLFSGEFDLYVASIPEGGNVRRRGSAIVARRAGVELWRIEMVQVVDGELGAIRVERPYRAYSEEGTVSVRVRAEGGDCGGASIALTAAGELLFYTLEMG